MIELLVVIMIIGILSALTLLSSLKAINKAREVEPISRLNALIQSQEIYYHESREFYDCPNTINWKSLEKEETENYHYYFLCAKSEGFIYAAIAKKPGLRSYAIARYLKHGELEHCRRVEVPLQYPIDRFKLLLFLYQVKSNPNNYC